MKRLFLLYIISLSTILSFSQTQNDSINPAQKKYVKTLNLNIENGAVISNGSSFADELANSNYYNGIDLRLGFRKTNRYDTYSTFYRRPTLGVGYYSSTFNNPKVGTPTALYFFLDMPFKFAEDKNLAFSYSAAFGLSYNFSPYDSINNPTNLLIGSYKNCYVDLGFSAHYRLSDRWSLNGKIGFKHFSNGSFKKPNSGLNLVPIALGATYKLTDEPIYEYKTPLPKYIHHNLFNVSMTFGSKNYEIGEPNYLKMGWGLNYLRQVSYSHRIGAGLDVFYSSHANLRTESGEAGFAESVSFALVASWEWLITERLYAPMGIGLYMHHNPANDEKQVYYERVGLRYRITDHIAAGLTIKAHGGSADIFEWTIAYTFHDDPNKIIK